MTSFRRAAANREGRVAALGRLRALSGSRKDSSWLGIVRYRGWRGSVEAVLHVARDDMRRAQSGLAEFGHEEAQVTAAGMAPFSRRSCAIRTGNLVEITA